MDQKKTNGRSTYATAVKNDFKAHRYVTAKINFSADDNKIMVVIRPWPFVFIIILKITAVILLVMTVILTVTIDIS